MTVEHIATIVESITGADPLKEGRARPNVDARVLLVQVLRAQGYTQQRIGDLLGYKRITIQHYCALFAEARQYRNAPDLLRAWDKLKTILDL